MSDRSEIEWAPRVSLAKIRELYVQEARGDCDDELIEAVGFALYARCAGILEFTEACAGRVRCKRCANAGRETIIEDVNGRIFHQGARNRDALLLAAREFLRERVHPVLQADPLQHLERAPALLHVGDPQDPEREDHVLEDRLAGHELEVLEDEADGAAVGLDLRAAEAHEVAAADDHDAVAAVTLGMARSARHEWAEAVSAYEQALRVSPFDPQTRCGLAEAYARMNDPRAARERRACDQLKN